MKLPLAAMTDIGFKTKNVIRLVLGIVTFVLVSGPVAWSEPMNAHDHSDAHDHSLADRPMMTDEAVQNVMATGVDEKTGGFIALDAEFYDEEGRKVRLGDLVDRPTVILPIFFYCPVVCPLLLANLASALPDVPFTPGEDYRVVALSFNDDETPAVAKDAKKDYMTLLPESFPGSAWSFLTGDEQNILAFTESMGYRFKKTASNTFVHPNALVIVSDKGKVIRYIYGSSFLGADIGMGISEAQKGTPGISIKRILSYCFNYDPAGRRYLILFFKVAALFTVLLLVLFFIFFLRRPDEDKDPGMDSEQGDGKKPQRKQT